MKKEFCVEVRETYRKTVNVIVESEDDIGEELAMMNANGEIDWDDEDFEDIEAVTYYELPPTDDERKKVEQWALTVVRIAEMNGGEWFEKMTREECCEWFEMLHDLGINIPAMATSQDLWDAMHK